MPQALKLISSACRDFVPSRTSTQIASHAQKYMARQNGATKRKSKFTDLEAQVRAFIHMYSWPTWRPSASRTWSFMSLHDFTIKHAWMQKMHSEYLCSAWRGGDHKDSIIIAQSTWVYISTPAQLNLFAGKPNASCYQNSFCKAQTSSNAISISRRYT